LWKGGGGGEKSGGKRQNPRAGGGGGGGGGGAFFGLLFQSRRAVDSSPRSVISRALSNIQKGTVSSL